MQMWMGHMTTEISLMQTQTKRHEVTLSPFLQGLEQFSTVSEHLLRRTSRVSEDLTAALNHTLKTAKQ